MTIQQLRYVVTISEMGSLNKASEVLYVTQPSLTSAVQELERELGITIFRRSGRGVTLTNDGTEFMQYARQITAQYDRVLEKYGRSGSLKKKFGISTQHYTFAVKCFVEMVQAFDTEEYEFAIREEKTLEVIEDVSTDKSEIGILYLSDFNRKAIGRLLRAAQLEFHSLTECAPYVYLWKGHPLAGKSVIRPADLEDYPCMSFEQGGSGSFYFSEEILSTREYVRTIKVTDRATMLNLMVGLNGYTLCSGIICEELNGTQYTAVAFDPGEEGAGERMELGYIMKKNLIPSKMAELYISELKNYLSRHGSAGKQESAKQETGRNDG